MPASTRFTTQGLREILAALDLSRSGLIIVDGNGTVEYEDVVAALGEAADIRKIRIVRSIKSAPAFKTFVEGASAFLGEAAALEVVVVGAKWATAGPGLRGLGFDNINIIVETKS